MRETNPNTPDRLTVSEVTAYDAGYSRESVLRKLSAAAASVLLLGSLASCGQTLAGNMEVQYDGYMAISPSDYATQSTSPDTGSQDELQLDGDMVCVSDDVSDVG